MLFIQERHDTVVEEKWDAKKVKSCILDDFYKTVDAFDYKSLWPTHKDEDTSDNPSKNIYMGAMGTLLGLFNTHKNLKLSDSFDFDKMAEAIVLKYYEQPDFGQIMPSYFFGESGILHAYFIITKNYKYLDKLFKSLESNIGNPANEMLNGDPGTMQVSLDMYHRTNEHKWLNLYKKSTMRMLEDSIEYGQGVWGWNQKIFGKEYKFLGAAHGIFGNYGAMLEGIDHLEDKLGEHILSRLESTILKTVTIEKDLANWTTSYDDKRFLTQWCHGAPGIIQEILKYKGNFSDEVSNIIIKSGNLIYEAGTVKKGVSLCHGTIGNALSLYKIYEYTNDELWIKRAQKMFMSSLHQIDYNRYSLWTGKQGALEVLSRYYS